MINRTIQLLQLMNNSQLKNTNQGDISFSVPKWKQHELKQIRFSEEEDFYRSTAYNLNDFKSQNKNQEASFLSMPISSLKQIPNQLNICKELKNKKNISTAIFVTYLYQFMSRTTNYIQKNIHQLQRLNSGVKGKQQKQGQQKQQKLVDNKAEIKFEMMKQLKKKIYGIDLCIIQEIPQKFNNFYKNDILKKIIFQYLTKCMRNTSLVQILLENNQFLIFALSLICKSLLAQNQVIKRYEQQVSFSKQVQTFLFYFDQVPADIQSIASKILPSQIIETHQNIGKLQAQTHTFFMFSCSKNQMNSISTSLKVQIDQSKSLDNVRIYLYRKQTNSRYQKIGSEQTKKMFKQPAKQNKIKIGGNSKGKIQSQKQVVLKNQKGKGCLQSLACWRFFQ